MDDHRIGFLDQLLQRLFSNRLPAVGRRFLIALVYLFICKGRVLVGELTFYPWGGFTPFSPAEAERTLGQMVSLPQRENEE